MGRPRFDHMFPERIGDPGGNEADRVASRLTSRMAWSFALGGAVCVLGQGASYHYGFSAGFFVTFPAGALATVLSFGGVRELRRAELVQSIRAMLGFGVCHILLLFSAISLQASVDPVFGALAWGLA